MADNIGVKQKCNILVKMLHFCLRKQQKNSEDQQSKLLPIL